MSTSESHGSSRKRHTGTQAVHAGSEAARAFDAVGTPIIQSSTYAFKDNAELEAYLAGDIDRHLYSRWSNPTVCVAESKLAALEGAEGALAFSSGMAAITSTVLSYVKSGDRILALDSLYGATYEFLAQLCPRWGIQVVWSTVEDLVKQAQTLEPKPNLIYVESPTNPQMKVVDLMAVTRAARERGIPVVMDNTFATPILQRPLEQGADVVVHSATKYLAGHSDVLCGMSAGSQARIKEIWNYRKLLGGILNAGSAALLIRGMKTLELRVKRQCDNALTVARFLRNHPRVESVNYPGLEDDPYHARAKAQMSGYTGMLAFTVKGGLEEARRVTDRLGLILYASSLGGVESVASLPVRTSHIRYSPEDLAKAGVTPGMIRLSCGVESAEDLVLDLQSALG